jgi:pimeloyl-ACP methyl ester carboxylesterase
MQQGKTAIAAVDAGEKFAPANGITLCYETFGEARNPPALLIMGLGAHMIQWDDEFCKALAERGFWVVRFDNRDIGKSSKIDSPAGDAAPYLIRDMAADAIGLMDFLGVNDAGVVGFSMGGMIAQEMAIHWPERVRSLGLIATSTGDPALPPPSPAIMAIFQAPPPRTAEDYVAANLRAWKAMRGPGFPGEEERDQRRAERAARRGLCPEGSIRQLQARLASGGRKEELRRVRAPTVVVHGGDDPLLPIEHGEDLARSIPGAKLVVIERMGHFLPAETWPTVIEAIASAAR